MLVAPGFSSSPRLVDVLPLVEGEFADVEELLGVPVGLHAHREHDQVVLGLADRAAVLDVLVLEHQIAVRPLMSAIRPLMYVAPMALACS